MSRNQSTHDEIRDQHLDTMIRLAFHYADALEAQEWMQEQGSAQPNVDEAHARATYDRFLDKLAKQESGEKKRERIVRLRRTIPKVIQIAACLVLALGIAAPLAVANVEAIRVKVMELLIHIQEDHTELEFVENADKAFYVPAGWNGSYYPSYIPEGFTLSERSNLYCDVTYVNAEGAKIYFSEYRQEDLVNINSEDATLSYTTINAQNAFVIERENLVIIAWASEDRFFVVEAEIPKEEALRIAESVRKISL